MESRPSIRLDIILPASTWFGATITFVLALSRDSLALPVDNPQLSGIWAWASWPILPDPL
jgi:hypothetical protein